MDSLQNSDKSIIRKATMDDLEKIQIIARESFSIYVERMNKEPFPMLDDYAAHIGNGHAHVLETGDKLVGYLVLLPQEDGSIMLDTVAVSPSCQKKGYGKALIQFAEDLARERGASVIKLYTNEAMRENLLLYPRLGYKESHRQMQKGYSRVFFFKRLRP